MEGAFGSSTELKSLPTLYSRLASEGGIGDVQNYVIVCMCVYMYEEIFLAPRYDQSPSFVIYGGGTR